MSDDVTTRVLSPISMPFVHASLDVTDAELEAQRERSRELVESNASGWGADWADRCGSWNSMGISGNILDEEEVYGTALEDLGILLDAFTDAMRMDWSGMTPIVMDSWLNANPPGNVQECHIHCHCYISCVYYIHVPEGDGGEFILDNPLSYEHEVGCGPLSPYTDKTVDVKSGDLIMFPSNIEHHTRINKSDEYRYSLAFNITTEELQPLYKTSDGGSPWGDSA